MRSGPDADATGHTSDTSPTLQGAKRIGALDMGTVLVIETAVGQGGAIVSP